MMDAPIYFGYADANPKKPVSVKLADAIAAYRRKHGREPGSCRVHPETAAQLADSPILVVADGDVPRANFYLSGGEP